MCSWSISTPRQYKKILSRKSPPQPISSTNPTEIEVPAVVDLIMEVLVITPNWTVLYIAYLLRQELPEDEAYQIVHRSKAFTMIRGIFTGKVSQEWLSIASPQKKVE